MSSGVHPARLRLLSRSRRWALGFGAENPNDRPSCVIAVARIRAYPGARKFCGRCMTTATAPSLGRKPSASAEKVAHLPDGEAMPADARKIAVQGEKNIVDAITTAAVQSPFLIAEQAVTESEVC